MRLYRRRLRKQRSCCSTSTTGFRVPRVGDKEDPREGLHEGHQAYGAQFDDIGLEIKIVYSDGIERLSRRRRTLSRRGFSPIQGSDAERRGLALRWRIDTLAVLAAALALITSKQGKATSGRPRSCSRDSYPIGRWIRTSPVHYGRATSTGRGRYALIGWRYQGRDRPKKLMGIMPARCRGEGGVMMSGRTGPFSAPSTSQRSREHYEPRRPECEYARLKSVIRCPCDQRPLNAS
jgi:hypothetical protein